MPDVRRPGDKPGTILEILLVFLKLGLTSFGGPIAHLGYFRAEFVERRRWLSEGAYADLVALAQFLPGPASSQTGFAIGLMRGGYLGGIAAWVGFTLPSAILMLLFAYGAGGIATTRVGAGVLHGLKLVAVAIVAQAVLGMARSLCPDRARASIAVVTIFLVLIAPGSFGQVTAIILGGLAGTVFCRGGAAVDANPVVMPVSKRAGVVCLAAFVMVLAAAFMPLHEGAISLFTSFYRSGALVFGGGHVVLPLLRDAIVAPGWVSDDIFLAGYGAAQAMPGPLFTFAAYLGALANVAPGGFYGAMIALFAIFAPGVLILMAILPFWSDLRVRPGAQAAMRGTNAAVVGLLAIALYTPVWTSAVINSADFAIAVTGFVLLVVWRMSPLLIVALTASAGAALTVAL